MNWDCRAGSFWFWRKIMWSEGEQNEFGSVVRAVLDAADEIAAGVGDAERAAMRRHFTATSRYEWMFWDMGWRCECWPGE